MAIQMRRGLKANFDPTKLLPGEWAVAIDTATSNQIVWMCFAPGVVKRMGTYEDFKNMIGEISADIRADIIDATNKANASASKADEATVKANNAAANANEAARAVLDEKYILTTRGTFTNSISESPTAKGNVIVEKIGGATYQNAYEGKQVLPFPYKNSTKTESGVTFTVNNDTSITGSGTSTAGLNFYLASLTALSGTFTLARYGTFTGMDLLAYNDSKGKLLARLEKDSMSQTFTAESGDVISIYINYGHAGTVVSGTMYPMLVEGETALPWEPFVGGTPAPNPGHPQRIKAVGDKGWFDGELLQGYYYATNGILSVVSQTMLVCNKNKIPCKPGNTIKLEYEKIVHSLGIIFCGDNNNYIDSRSATNTNYIECVVPDNASCLYFNIRESSTEAISPSTAKHISVTINGKYAWIGKRTGKNLADDSQYTLTGGQNHFLYYDTPKKMNLGTYTISYQCSLGTPSGFYVRESGSSAALYTAYGKNYITFTLSEEKELFFYVYYANGGVTEETKGVFQLEEGSVATEFEPYTEQRVYIPLDAPMYDGDYIRLNNGKYEVVRNRGVAVLDGTEDNWAVAGSGFPYRVTPDQNIERVNNSEKISSSHFRRVLNTVMDTSKGEGSFCQYTSSTTTYWYFNYDSQRGGLDNFKAWLAEQYANGTPVKVVYKLAEPIVEELDQTPFYELTACDCATNIEVMGLSDNLHPTNTIRFPRSEDGALVTTDFANGKKNEIKMSELETKLATVMLNLV